MAKSLQRLRTEEAAPSPLSLLEKIPTPEQSKALALEALKIAVEQRALDPLALFISPHTSVGDYFVIASGTSQRHAQGIADKIREHLSSMGERVLHFAGYENAEWIILDYGNIVVHIFYEPSRHYYKLDELWAKAVPVQLEGKLAEEAKKLRTGILN